MAKRHFAYQHPTFGTKNKPNTPSYWQRSVYYWWFEYLKRNEGYRDTCKMHGVGNYAELYTLFGDVHANDFKAWWTESGRGVKLFAEPVASYELIELQQPISVSSVVNPDLVYLQVPLNLPKRYLKKRFDEIISKYHEGKRGHTYARKSMAMYSFIGQPNIPALRLTLCMTIVEHTQNCRFIKLAWR